MALYQVPEGVTRSGFPNRRGSDSIGRNQKVLLPLPRFNRFAHPARLHTASGPSRSRFRVAIRSFRVQFFFSSVGLNDSEVIQQTRFFFVDLLEDQALSLVSQLD